MNSKSGYNKKLPKSKTQKSNNKTDLNKKIRAGKNKPLPKNNINNNSKSKRGTPKDPMTQLKQEFERLKQENTKLKLENSRLKYVFICN